MCLARSKNDFAAIRKECEQLRLKYNAGLKDEEIAYRDQPDTQEVSALRKWANGSPDIKAERNKRLLVYAILLIIHMFGALSATMLGIVCLCISFVSVCRMDFNSAFVFLVWTSICLIAQRFFISLDPSYMYHEEDW